MLLEYHAKRAEAKKKRHFKEIKKPKEIESNDAMADFVEKETENTFMQGEFLSEEDNSLPIKVLNITHIKGEEEKLVAHILFEGSDEPAFVYAEWANKYCPQLVIAYYESRIHWEKKS